MLTMDATQDHRPRQYLVEHSARHSQPVLLLPYDRLGRPPSFDLSEV